MTALKFREGDQQLPVVNDLPAVQDLVIQDVEERKALGISRYGTMLQPLNGRNGFRDLYEELLDAVNYMRQVQEERLQMAKVLDRIISTLDQDSYSVVENDVNKLWVWLDS